jgi:hypothetical protein
MIQQGESTGTPKDNLRAMRILAAALITGVVLFVVVVVVINLVKGSVMGKDELEYNNIFLYAAIGIALVCYMMARTIYKKKLAVVKNAPASLADKLNQYMAMLITYMAPCEGAALFSVIVVFLTGNFFVLIVTVAMLAAMVSKFPFTKAVINELDLDWKEQQELI